MYEWMDGQAGRQMWQSNLFDQIIIIKNLMYVTDSYSEKILHYDMGSYTHVQRVKHGDSKLHLLNHLQYNKHVTCAYVTLSTGFSAVWYHEGGVRFTFPSLLPLFTLFIPSLIYAGCKIRILVEKLTFVNPDYIRYINIMIAILIS